MRTIFCSVAAILFVFNYIITNRPIKITRSLRSPSSSVNFRSFFDFGTASQAKILTARKSDFANVSKSTISSKIDSIFTLEKSIFSDSVFTFFQGLQKLYYLHHFSYLHHLMTSSSGFLFRFSHLRK